MASQAALISYNGYERDSGSTIVRGGGLEWLMWDIPKGMSINDTLSLYSVDGWKLASNKEVAALFNEFQFGKSDWNDHETIAQVKTLPWSTENYSSHANFMELFGTTLKNDSSYYSTDDPVIGVLALFGEDENGNGRYNMVTMNHAYTTKAGIKGEAAASLSWDWFVANESYRETGVVLVRDIKPAPNTPVPLPGSLSLLALGFITLGYRRRKAQNG